ncbi:hypothetical protein D3C86_2071550 [compost metagenome]
MSNVFAHAILTSEFSTNMVMFTFHFVRDCLANVMEERGNLCYADIRTDFFGNKSCHMRHFSTMQKDVLTIRCAIFKLTQQA